MSHTASKPHDAISSHSLSGTLPSATALPCARPRAFSHAQVLFSYMRGLECNVHDTGCVRTSIAVGAISERVDRNAECALVGRRMAHGRGFDYDPAVARRGFRQLPVKVLRLRMVERRRAQ